MSEPLARLSDWEERLGAFLESVFDAQFVWGTHDCSLFGADIVNAQTGVDHGAPFRGKYTDRQGAALALREYGAGTITRTFDRHLPRIATSHARRGDLAMVKEDGGSVGVVIGNEALFISPDGGLVRSPRSAWARAWRVG